MSFGAKRAGFMLLAAMRGLMGSLINHLVAQPRMKRDAGVGSVGRLEREECVCPAGTTWIQWEPLAGCRRHASRPGPSCPWPAVRFPLEVRTAAPQELAKTEDAFIAAMREAVAQMPAFEANTKSRRLAAEGTITPTQRALFTKIHQHLTAAWRQAAIIAEQYNKV